MEFYIRHAASDKAAIIARLLNEAFGPVAEKLGLTPENCPTHPSFAKQNWIEWEFEHGAQYFLGCKAEGCVVACASIMGKDETTAELRRVATTPECQNRGIGKKMVGYAEAECIKMGFRQIEIGTVARQKALHRWYISLGYRDTVRRSFPQLPFKVQFMVKRI